MALAGPVETIQAVLERSEQMELKYRSRIIELEKQRDYEAKRANDYEAKFKEALLSSSQGMDRSLLDKLTNRENELATLRATLMDSQRRQNTRTAQLMKNNAQLTKIIEDVKNTAIAAIVQKDLEIERLIDQLKAYEMQQAQLIELQDKLSEAEKEKERIQADSNAQIKRILAETSQQRMQFLAKYQQLEQEVSKEESAKQQLLQKTNNLIGTIETSEQQIGSFQGKINELQAQVQRSKITLAEKTAYFELSIRDLKDEIGSLKRSQQGLQSLLKEAKTTQQNQQSTIEKLKDQIQIAEHKLKIQSERRKQLTSSLCSSFQGMANRANVYSSFLGQNQEGLIPIDEGQERGTANKLAQIVELNYNYLQNFSEQDLQDIQYDEPSPSPPLITEAISYSSELTQQLESALRQMQSLHDQVANLTKELQEERVKLCAAVEAKANSRHQKQLIIDIEELKQHIFKLENALLIEKLQCAEKAEYFREKNEALKRENATKVQLLNQQLLEATQKKKKKGFFG